MKSRPKREIGTIYTWVKAGWGFAKPHARGFAVHVHKDNVIAGIERVRVGAEIEFEMGPDMRRPYAMNIKVS